MNTENTSTNNSEPFDVSWTSITGGTPVMEDDTATTRADIKLNIPIQNGIYALGEILQVCDSLSRDGVIRSSRTIMQKGTRNRFVLPLTETLVDNHLSRLVQLFRSERSSRVLNEPDTTTRAVGLIYLNLESNDQESSDPCEEKWRLIEGDPNLSIATFQSKSRFEPAPDQGIKALVSFASTDISGLQVEDLPLLLRQPMRPLHSAKSASPLSRLGTVRGDFSHYDQHWTDVEAEIMVGIVTDLTEP